MCERGYSFLPSCLTPIIPFGAWAVDLQRWQECHGRFTSQAECVEIEGNKQHATVDISKAQEQVAAKRRRNE